MGYRDFVVMGNESKRNNGPIPILKALGPKVTPQQVEAEMKEIKKKYPKSNLSLEALEMLARNALKQKNKK